MKVLSYAGIVLLGALLLYAAHGLPNRATVKAVVNQEETIVGSPVASYYYIQNAYNDTHTPNIVTAVLADYRSYDTLGEEAVIFAAGIICFLLLRREKKCE